MKESAHTDPSFEERLRKDDVVRLYRSISDQQPPEALDKAVLETYRRVVRPTPSKAHLPWRWWRRIGTGAPRDRRPLAFGWPVPLSLTAGLLLGITLSPLIQQHPDQGAPGIAAPAGRSPESAQEIIRGLPTEGALAPDPWLKRIARLVLQGHVVEAEAEIIAFQRQYPGYKKSLSP